MSTNNIIMLKTKKTNVAPTSTEGHFVNINSLCLDEITETFLVEETCSLTTHNHTDLEINLKGGEIALIICQKTYNSDLGIFQRAKD